MTRHDDDLQSQSLQDRDIERRLGELPRAEPPADLLGRLQAEIPDLPASSRPVARLEPVSRPRSRSGPWLALAATLVVLAGAGFLTWSLRDDIASVPESVREAAVEVEAQAAIEPANASEARSTPASPQMSAASDEARQAEVETSDALMVATGDGMTMVDRLRDRGLRAGADASGAGNDETDALETEDVDERGQSPLRESQAASLRRQRRMPAEDEMPARPATSRTVHVLVRAVDDAVPLAGADVVLCDGSSELGRTVTDPNGRADFDGLMIEPASGEVRDLTVHARLEGFQPISWRARQTTSHEISPVLRLAERAIAESSARESVARESVARESVDAWPAAGSPCGLWFEPEPPARDAAPESN